MTHQSADLPISWPVRLRALLTDRIRVRVVPRGGGIVDLQFGQLAPLEFGPRDVLALAEEWESDMERARR